MQLRGKASAGLTKTQSPCYNLALSNNRIGPQVIWRSFKDKSVAASRLILVPKCEVFDGQVPGPVEDFHQDTIHKFKAESEHGMV